MRKRKSLVWSVLGLFVVASMLLAACGGATAAPTQPPVQEVTEEPAEPTEAATEAPEATEAATEVAAGEDYSPEIVVDEPVTITFANFNDMEGSNFWETLRAEFEATHPNIQVEFEVTPGDELFDKLLTQIATGNPPDAAYVSDWMTGAFAQEGGLAPLDDYIAKSNLIDIDD